MFNLQGFISCLDELYENSPQKLEEYMRDGLAEAKAADDVSATLTILNELMGYYRVTSRFEECEVCIQEAQKISGDLGIRGTLNYATVLLNIATAYRMMGKLEVSEKCYQQVCECYERELKGPDYRMAAFYNNRSLLYADMGRLKEAKQDLERAMELLEMLDEDDMEVATTHVNIGNICFALQKNKEGMWHMQMAESIFAKKEGRKDAHYASALSGLGEAYFREGQLELSIGYYEKALKELKESYGENEYFHITKRNLVLVQNIYNRREAVRQGNVKGLELSRAYYEEYGKPMLLRKYPEYLPRIAAGLVGEGSECLGYDDEYSADHDYGAGFCIWLTKKDYDEIGEQMQEDYRKLPGEFRGVPVRNETEQGEGRVGVWCIDDFYCRYTGVAIPPEGRGQTAEWMKIDAWALRTVTNGEVFEDHLGEFTRRRAGFEKYPDEVRCLKLAGALGRMAQAGQYNYSRMKKRGDEGAAWLCVCEFVNAAIEAAYLLNRKFMPIYKWRMRGLEEFECLHPLKSMLLDVMRGTEGEGNSRKDEEPADSHIESWIECICRLFVRELNKQGLSHSKESFLEEQKKEVMQKIFIDQIVEAEWEQFQEVKNEGGRASCQDDRETFVIMRTSQFLTWDVRTLESYLNDLTEAKKRGRNLVTEKYARMMESTAPERYEELKGWLPIHKEERMKLQEDIVAKEVRWEEKFAEEYPGLSGQGRVIHTAEDTLWNTSSETYVRGELGTYSDHTVLLYREMISKMEKKGENHIKKIMEYTVRFYGYRSLEEAEQRCGGID